MAGGATNSLRVWGTVGVEALAGRQAAWRMPYMVITATQTGVPLTPRPPMVSSGVRIGTPALAARGFDLDDFAEVADVIAAALRPSAGEEQLAELRTRVTRLADRHPLYPDLTEVFR